MSSLWQENAEHRWQSVAVHSSTTLDGSAIGVPGIAIYGLTQSPQRGALLMAQPGVWVRVNGLPLLGGARVLEHTDEILVGNVRLCFSAESTPVLATYKVPEGGRPAVCPICRGPIRDGMTAVECPGCGRWFHQLPAADGRPAKPCWTYAPTCRFCNHPTAFGTEAVWRPDQEDAHA
jgi:hypothetical protein